MGQDPKPITRSKEVAIMQALWRKAGKADAPITLDCKTPANLTKVRFALYNAVRKVRAHPEIDFELADAVQACSITVKSPSVLEIGRRELDPLIQQMAAMLEEAEEEILPEAGTISKEQIQASQQAIMERLGMAGGELPKTEVDATDTAAKYGARVTKKD